MKNTLGAPSLVVGFGPVGKQLTKALLDQGALVSLARSATLRERPEVYNERHYDMAFFTGVSAGRYQANADPRQDLANVLESMKSFKAIRAREIVMISTSSVFSDDAYGANRLIAEDIAAEWSHQTGTPLTVVRLPMLVGKGVTKNVLFDIMNGNTLWPNLPPAYAEAMGSMLDANPQLGLWIEDGEATRYMPSAQHWLDAGVGTHSLSYNSVYHCFNLPDVFEACYILSVRRALTRKRVEFFNTVSARHGKVFAFTVEEMIRESVQDAKACDIVVPGGTDGEPFTTYPSAARVTPIECDYSFGEIAGHMRAG